MSLWRKWKTKFRRAAWDRTKRNDTVYVAFLSSGGVGDLVVNMNFISAFKKHCEAAGGRLEIDLFHSAKLIESLYDRDAGYLTGWYDLAEYREKFEGKYDLVFGLRTRSPKPFSCRFRRVSTICPEALRLRKLYAKHCDEHAEFFDQHPRWDGLYGQLMAARGYTRLQEADIDHVLGIEDYSIRIPVQNGEKTLKTFGLKPGEYLTFNNSVDTTFEGSRSTKQWFAPSFEGLFKILHEKHPEMKLVYLGPTREDILAPYVCNLSGRTTFEELKVLLKNTKLHVGPEGGMVHMRRAMGAENGGKSCVLFGPTTPDVFGYAENINLEEKSACPARCEWMTPKWQMRCACGKDAVCRKMQALTPEKVFEAIEGELR